MSSDEPGVVEGDIREKKSTNVPVVQKKEK
jgi:hypothetical protein